MEFGEVRPVEEGSCDDLYLVETGMYDTAGYGAVYILDAERPAIIESGIGTNHERILEALPEVGLSASEVALIAVTHVHLDHAGGAGFLAKACPNATVVAHEIGAPHLVDTEALVEGTKQAVGEQWQYYVEPEPVPEDRLDPIAGGDAIDLGDHQLRALAVPGHAPHQVVYHDPAIAAVFTGDAAGIWIPEWEEVRQTCPPPQFDLDQAVADLETIAGLDPETLLYSHFGPAPYSDGLLESYEARLAEWVRDVDELHRELGSRDAIVDELFARSALEEVWGAEKARGEIEVNVDGALTYLERIRGEE